MGSNRDWGVDSQTITAPPFAGPGDPAISFGPDIPAEIIAYYAALNATPIAMIQMRQSVQDYIAFVLVDPVIGRSYVDVVGMESVGLVVSAANRWRMGTFGAETSFDILTDRGSVVSGAVDFDSSSALVVEGTSQFANEAFGSVSITPVASVPTSASVSYASLTGAGSMSGYTTPNTTVVGSTVQGTAITSITATSAVVWVFRTNNTSTSINWLVKRQVT